MIAAFAPRLAMILLAGCVAAGVAALLLLATRRASFATRSTALQACIIVLLVVSLLELMPRGWRRIADAVPASHAVSLLATTTIGQPMQRLAGWSRPSAPSSDVARMIVAALVLAWGVGAALALLRLAHGSVIVRGIRRRARPDRDRAVLVSDEVDVPFVHGIRSPVIVVPAGSADWSDATWHAVILHETSHVTRGDVAAQWARQVVLALHWCNPAVHWLARQAEDAGEGACDDAVLLRGTQAACYAETLLSFAGARWRLPHAPVPTMARRNGLERRVLAMLCDERLRRLPRRRDRVGPRLVGVCSAAIIALALPKPMAIPAAAAAGAQATRHASPVRAPARTDSVAPGPAAANDTTEALLGLATLLDDANPIVRATARDALHAWGGLVATHLAPVARTGDPDRRRRARAALAAMEDTR